MNAPVNMDMIVEAYIATRDEIKRLEKELEDKLKPLKEFQENRELYMLGLLNSAGCQNMKTKHGTAYVLTKESVTMGDWDAFKSWAIESPLAKALTRDDIPVEVREEVYQAFKQEAHIEFLTHSVAKKAVQEKLEEGEPVPPGVNFVQVKTVGIRKG